jgi:hypothetical protein
MHQLLTTKQVEAYRPFQDIESRQLCWDYLHNPEKFYLHNGRYANSGMSLKLINDCHHVCCIWKTHSS